MNRRWARAFSTQQGCPRYASHHRDGCMCVHVSPLATPVLQHTRTGVWGPGPPRMSQCAGSSQR